MFDQEDPNWNVRPELVMMNWLLSDLQSQQVNHT